MSQDLAGMRCKHYSVKHACVLYQALGNMTLQHMQIFAFAKVVGVSTHCVHAETNHEIYLHAKNSCKSIITCRLNSYLHVTASSPKTLSCAITLAEVRQPFEERGQIDLHDITGFGGL